MLDVKIFRLMDSFSPKRNFDNFSNQKNFAIKKSSNDWIFLLDADETISEVLKEEILQSLNSNKGFSAFYVYRCFFFKNKKFEIFSEFFVEEQKF